MKILIADDHPIVRQGLIKITKEMDESICIEEGSEGYEVLSKIENNKYDIILLDISMPGLSGLDILKILRDRNIKVNVLILSMHSEEQFAVRALNLGASGYLCKNSIYQELTKAINKISYGGKYISSSLAEKFVTLKNKHLNQLPHEALSEREFQIMCMIAKGKSIKEIANDLFISDKTVSTYRSRLLQKMNMKGNSELAHYTIKNNLIE